MYWGDLHAHCAISYGTGTPQRALANARTHLDFCSITGHAFWPDMPMDLGEQNAIIGMHLGGFAKLQHYWPELLRRLQDADEPGRFVTFPSYEWHSMQYGDYNCYAPTFDLPLLDGPDPGTLARRVEEATPAFMLLPHHGGYVRGQRGTNWAAFDDRVSPLVEVYSNHGSCEGDDAPGEYHHSMGPRVGESTVRTGLVAGHRFGFYAGTDTHDGYPGHYGHGRVGVDAPALDRPHLWEALRARRTVATTGARIAAEVALSDVPIGGVAGRADAMPLRLRVAGTAPIERVDLVEGGGDGWRVRRLQGKPIATDFAPGRYKVKVETGWGRGRQRSDWHVRAAVQEGRLLGVEPCFRYSGAATGEEAVTEGIESQDDTQVAWHCRAVANPAGAMGGTHFDAGGTQAMILDCDVGPRGRLRVTAGEVAFDLPFADLVRGSVGAQVRGFGSPALKVHRAVPEREFAFAYDETYHPSREAGFLYARIAQSDGQVAWASPIWYA